jgi:hypothetical protein
MQEMASGLQIVVNHRAKMQGQERYPIYKKTKATYFGNGSLSQLIPQADPSLKAVVNILFK